MANKSPYTWKPRDIVEITNVSGENFILHLDSGDQRLDAGRTMRFTGSTLDLPQLVILANSGKLKIDPWKKRK